MSEAAFRRRAGRWAHFYEQTARFQRTDKMGKRLSEGRQNATQERYVNA